MRLGEIVEEIVDNLRPWKNRNSRNIVTAQVNKTLDLLLKLIPLQKKVFDRRTYRDYTKKLDKALRNVETLLLSIPEALPFILCSLPRRL